MARQYFSPRIVSPSLPDVLPELLNVLNCRQVGTEAKGRCHDIHPVSRPRAALVKLPYTAPMIPDRSRKQARQAMLVIRSPARQQLAREMRTRHGQRVVIVPVEQTARADPDNAGNRPDPVTARLLLAHAHRARHLLTDRTVLTRVGLTRRDELLTEIRRMKHVMRTLEEEIKATMRSVEAMDDLADHLQRLTGFLHESGVMSHDAPRNPFPDPETSVDHSDTTDPVE